MDVIMIVAFPARGFGPGILFVNCPVLFPQCSQMLTISPIRRFRTSRHYEVIGGVLAELN